MDLKEKLKQTVKIQINTIIDADLYEWPPGCWGLLHQGHRPEAILQENNKDNPEV